MISKLDSKTIDVLRLPLAVMVVYIHNGGMFPDVITWNRFDLEHINLAVRVAFSHVFTHVSVPLFFIISGFLFFKGFEKWSTSLYFKKMRSRVKSLIVPYVLWIAIALIIGLFFKICGSFRHENVQGLLTWINDNIKLSAFWNIQEWNSDRLNWLGMPVPSSSPYLTPLWFVRDLIVMNVFAPFLYVLLRMTRKGGILLLFALYVSLVWPFFPGFDIESVFYYALGGWFSLWGVNMANRLRKFCYPLFFCFIVLGIVLVYWNGHCTFWGNKIYPFFICVGVLSIYGMASYVVESGNRRLLAVCNYVISQKDSVFFVFAAHTLILPYLNVMSRFLLPQNYFIDTLLYLLLPIIVVVLCIMAYRFMCKYTPVLSHLLTGRG